MTNCPRSSIQRRKPNLQTFGSACDMAWVQSLNNKDILQLLLGVLNKRKSHGSPSASNTCSASFPGPAPSFCRFKTCSYCNQQNKRKSHGSPSASNTCSASFPGPAPSFCRFKTCSYCNQQKLGYRPNSEANICYKRRHLFYLPVYV